MKTIHGNQSIVVTNTCSTHLQLDLVFQVLVIHVNALHLVLLALRLPVQREHLLLRGLQRRHQLLVGRVADRRQLGSDTLEVYERILCSPE